MVQLLPARCVVIDVQLPGPVRLAAGHRMATQATRRDQLEGPLPTVPDREARAPTGRGWTGVVPRPAGADRALPLAGEQHPHTVDQLAVGLEHLGPFRVRDRHGTYPAIA